MKVYKIGDTLYKVDLDSAKEVWINYKNVGVRKSFYFSDGDQVEVIDRNVFEDRWEESVKFSGLFRIFLWVGELVRVVVGRLIDDVLYIIGEISVKGYGSFVEGKVFGEGEVVIYRLVLRRSEVPNRGITVAGRVVRHPDKVDNWDVVGLGGGSVRIDWV